jgi:hypothetical protein
MIGTIGIVKIILLKFKNKKYYLYFMGKTKNGFY